MKQPPEYKQVERYTPTDRKEKQLIRAFSLLNDEKIASAFLRDLLTQAEIEEFANRLEIVFLLKKGWSYLDIAKKTNVSTTTVTRVAHWFFHGCGGYKTIVDKLSAS